MAKAAKKATPKSDLELNRWCIEMAMRWPVHSSGGYYSGHAQGVGVYTQHGGYVPPVHKDEDIIGRAEKIMAWLKRAH